MTTIRAESDCAKAGINFEKISRWQYLLTQREITDTILKRYSFGGWHLRVGDGVCVSKLEDAKGRAIGLFIGIGVDNETLVKGTHKIPSLDLDRDSFFEDFEDWLFYVSGRYNVFIAKGDSKRFYSDAVGMNGMVYDREERQVASSLALCIERDTTPHPLYDHSLIERGEGNYSLFHTYDKDVRRGNPNFYLDLNDFSETRFWPRDEDFTTDRSHDDIYGEIIQRTSKVIGEINANFKTALPLSGGQDSRLLASISRTNLAGFDQFFTHIHNYASRIDATIAGTLAKVLQVDHEIHDKRNIKVSEEDVSRFEAEFHAALGFKKKLTREVAHGLHECLEDRMVILRGHQTDLLRAVFIDKLGEDGRNNLRWQVKRLLIVPGKAFDRKTYRTFLPEYQNWVETLPENAAKRQVDLMFLEIYYSSTIGLIFPALTRNFFMSPFNSRHLISLSLSIEEGYRKNSFAVNDIIFQVDPELHDVPFDYEFGGADLGRIDDQQAMAELTAARRKASETRVALRTQHPDLAASEDVLVP
ncbi:hypothetical protein [Thioclava sp. F28-4]|uniref:hypothetical protein n=1 Tax=Thioclava sp. F28-4 TaxID=1915315 RepID=UPI0009981DBA|nr:hypothetical protein [Thioclava sp. F28-4]OOY05605.1 hypothetical protein BMI87_06115 [Thioclava sp. F28-4]